MKNKVRSYAELSKKRRKQLQRMERLIAERIIRGSIRVQGNRCGTKGCRCKRKKNPILHGPYPYLSYRGKKTNHSILLTRNKEEYAERAISNYKTLMNAIIDLSDIDFTILRYYSAELKRDKQ